MCQMQSGALRQHDVCATRNTRFLVREKSRLLSFRTTFNMTPHLTCWLWGRLCCFFDAVNYNLCRGARHHVNKRCLGVPISAEIDWLPQH